MTKRTGYLIILIVVVLVGVVVLSKKSPSQLTQTNQPLSGASSYIGQRTKTAGCVANGALADNSCTPGAVIATATKDQICVPGYSKSVRNVPASEKAEVFQEYGIATHTKGQYEVDHLVSLELGGSNDISNLWPETADPTPGFHQKDAVENYLHTQVCNGSIPLQQAQQQVATNWLAVYNSTH